MVFNVFSTYAICLLIFQAEVNIDANLSDLNAPLIIGLVVASVVTLATVALGVVHFSYIICYVTQRYRRAFIMFLAGTTPVSFYA